MAPVCWFLCYTSIVLLAAHRGACNKRYHVAREAEEQSPPLRVTSILANSFLMRSADGEGFVGFIPELLELMTHYVAFDYEINLVRDGKFGTMTANGTWNGMIGELMRGEADLAAAPLAVTSIRETVVDFTKPFMGSRIAALVNKQHATQLGINSIDDLANQSTMKYGVIASSVTEEIFRYSASPLFQRIWAQIEQDATTSRVQTVAEGIKRVRTASDEQPWALLADAVLLYDKTVFKCDLDAVGSYESYGLGEAFATPKGSPYLDRLTLAVLELLDSGELIKLTQKWFQPPNCNYSFKRFLLPPQ